MGTRASVNRFGDGGSKRKRGKSDVDSVASGQYHNVLNNAIMEGDDECSSNNDTSHVRRVNMNPEVHHTNTIGNNNTGSTNDFELLNCDSEDDVLTVDSAGPVENAGDRRDAALSAPRRQVASLVGFTSGHFNDSQYDARPAHVMPPGLPSPSSILQKSSSLQSNHILDDARARWGRRGYGEEGSGSARSGSSRGSSSGSRGITPRFVNVETEQKLRGSPENSIEFGKAANLVQRKWQEAQYIRPTSTRQ